MRDGSRVMSRSVTAVKRLSSSLLVLRCLHWWVRHVDREKYRKYTNAEKLNSILKHTVAPEQTPKGSLSA